MAAEAQNDPGSGQASAPGAGTNPAGSGATGAPPRRNHTLKRRVGVVLLVTLLAALAYGGFWWVYLRGTVSTDDALIDAHVVALSMQIPGRVVSVETDAGDRVTKDQVLARLDPVPLRIAVEQAKAALDEARARLDDLRRGPRPEDLAVSEAQVRLGQVQLERSNADLKRDLALAQHKAVPQVDLEHQRFTVAQARAQLELSKKQGALLRAGTRPEQIAVAKAGVELARAQLDQARTTLSDAVLRSPVDGVVAKRTVELGAVVQPGQALFQIVDTQQVWVVANLEETNLEGLKEGQPVDIQVDAYPDLTLHGQVGPVYWATLSRFSLLAASSASGSFIKVTQRVPVRIRFTDEKLPPLYPGLNVTVRIHLRKSGGD